MRESAITRKTGETDIELRLNLDGSGSYQISTGIGFLDHMLELFARGRQIPVGAFGLAIKTVSLHGA